MRDLRRLIREAHARGLRVITELVVNHTSDQHPWLQRARNAPPGSSHRNYYVWSDTDDKYPETRIIFLDTEPRSEEHTSELQSLMRNPSAVFFLKKKNRTHKEP